MDPFTALISGGLSVVGKLLGGGSNKTSNRVDLKQLVADAEAAGFNPLTVLRNGGAAGYMQTSAPPVLSSRQALGEALGLAGSFLADYDPMTDQLKQAEYDLRLAQIEQLNRQSASYFPPAPGKPGSMFDPIAGSGSGRKVGGGALSGLPLPPTEEVPTVTNPWPTSSGRAVNPDRPDAEAFEQRYGDSELLSTIYGVWQFGSDWLYNQWYQSGKEIEFHRQRRKGAPYRRQENLKKWRKQAEKNARDLGFAAELMR